MPTERRRSFWGWGWEDRFPNRVARANLARYAESVLGLGGLIPADPPGVENIALRAPRVAVPEELAPFASTSARDRLSHSYGKGYPDLVRGFAGEFREPPDAILRPRTEDELLTALAWASDAGVAVVPYGGGTSVVGGVDTHIPGYDAVVSLDLERLSRLVEVDPISRLARVEAGATGPGLEAQLAEHGLTLRHYPQSFEHSTVGGWIATRAGGHFATVITHIDDLVASTRMVTPTGRFETRAVPGSGAGPSPDALVLGSEGILGVITEAWLRVQPRPTHRASATVTFKSWDGAVDATRAIAQSGLYPANCRLLDKREAALNQVTTDGVHVLLLGFESTDHPVDAWLDRALALTRAHGGRSTGPVISGPGDDSGRPAQAERWRAAFLEAPYLFTAMVSMGAIVDTFETACSWAAFPALHATVVGEVRAAMRRVAPGARPFLSCRFTHVYPDGPAPYYTFITGGDPAGARSHQARLAAWAEIKDAASAAIMGNGGTITHHHAVGRVHRLWYDQQRPQRFADALSAVKRTLDPSWILNPGVLIDARRPKRPSGK